MEQIVIQRKSGGELRLFSYNQVSGVTRAEQTCELMGQDLVNISLVSATIIPFAIGDYAELFGARYTLNYLPGMVKVNDRRFEYEIKLEGPQYDLIKVSYLDIDSTGFSTGTSFSLMGDLEDFAKLIIRNAERVYGAGTWELATFPTGTETYNLTFTNETCLQALQNFCSTYDQHFDITGQYGAYKLHIRKNTAVMPDTFRYGRAKGLYTLERQTVSSKNILTRLFAFGSERNIAPTYRNGSPRLKMPLAAIHSEGQPYIQSGITTYGIIEGSVMFDDIYPHRTGTVTAIDSSAATGAELNFFDSSMPFDLEAKATNGVDTLYMLNGIDPKLTFNTGNLAGYEFTITNYDHSTKKFTLQRYTDARGQDFPSANTTAFRIQAGDQYVITDIQMPQTYIDAAEQELLTKAYQYLDDNSRPWVQYGLTVDENYIQSKADTGLIVVMIGGIPIVLPVTPGTIVNYFTLGNHMKVIDSDMGLDGNLQITAFTRDILRHYKYTLTLGEALVARLRKPPSIGTGTKTPTSKNGLDGPAANVINNLPNNPAFKTTEPESDSGGTDIRSILAASQPVTYPYLVPATGTELYNADFIGATVLVVVRGGISEGNYTHDPYTGVITFPDGIYEGETIRITLYRNIDELVLSEAGADAELITDIIASQPVTRAYVVDEGNTFSHSDLANSYIMLITRSGVIDYEWGYNPEGTVTFTNPLAQDETIRITFYKNISL